MRSPSRLRKIMCPALPPAILHRETLVQRLTTAIVGSTSVSNGTSPYKLLLLHAPAGYGKTTLLVDFAQQASIPCCWYQLDTSDTDIVIFIERLLASIRQHFPHFGTQIDPLLAGAIASNAEKRIAYGLETVIETLIEALSEEISERFALILCNYHEVNQNQDITHLINQLLQASSSCVLVIESRSIPDLDFAPLLAHHEMFAMSKDAFTLSIQEIHELAHIQGITALSEIEAERLATLFDGWLGGILLGTRLGNVQHVQKRGRNTSPLLQDISGELVDRQFLFAYVTNEVFKHHPQEYAFLKDACILQEMTPSFCDALLEHTDSDEHLYNLEQQSLFVTHSGSDSHLVYTCHPVLRDLLSHELRMQAPERFISLNRRAAELFGDAHEYEKAIAHALAADDNDNAAQFIIQAYQQIQSKQHAKIMLRLIQALPSEVTEQYPQLLLIQASIHLIFNNYSQALPLLDRACALQTSGSFPAIAPTDIPRFQGQLMFLRSKALFQEGRYQDTQLLCQQLLEATPIDEVELRAEAHVYFGMCDALLGNPPSGIEHLQKALQLWGRNTVRFQTAEANSALANIYELLGNFALAEHHLSRFMHFCEQLHNEKGKVSYLLRLGHFKHQQGAFDEAVSILTQALTMTQGQPGFEREAAYTLDNLGPVYQDQGLYSQSLQALEQALDLARQLGDNFLINYCLSDLSVTYLLMGDAATALLLLSETNLPPKYEENIGHERAVHDLAYGLILLYQRRYEEASPFLIDLVASLQKANFKYELLRAELSLAACHIARSKQEEAVRCLEEIAAILESHDYGQITLVRLKRFPEVYQLITTQPTLARLRTLLQIEPSAQELKTITTQGTTPAPQLTASNQNSLKIQAFGEPAVFLDEQPVTRWRMARAMQLFFFLLDVKHPVRKDHILTALWSEEDEPSDHTLHSTIYYLRKALGDACITSQKGLYSLNLTALYGDKIYYDVAFFQEHHNKAKQACAQNDDDVAKTALLTMVDLYRGDYVQPFYSDWCTLRRDELRTAYLDARRSLAQLAWHDEAWEESATHWQHILAVDTCREEAHYGLMRCYLRQGKRNLALRQYQRCRDILQQELGVQPGTALQTLYQRLTETTSH